MSNNNTEYKNTIFVSSRSILQSMDIHSAKPISSISVLLNYNFSQIREGSSVYICSSAIPFFAKNVLPILPCRIVLVSGDSDTTCPFDMFDTIDTFTEVLNHPNIIHWFSQNLSFYHHKITHIPIGLDYHTLASAKYWWGPQMSPKITSLQPILISKPSN